MSTEASALPALPAHLHAELSASVCNRGTRTVVVRFLQRRELDRVGLYFGGKRVTSNATSPAVAASIASA
jgi:hypothetical protein